jgi:hypothetical protein
MNKIKLAVLAGLLLGFSACDSSTSQKEEETNDTTELKQDSITLTTQEDKEVVKEIVRDNRTPNGSYFKAEIGGVENIFDFSGNTSKANHYDARSEQKSSSIRMVRFTDDERSRISIQIVGLSQDMDLPVSIPNDSLGVQMKFSYYYTTGEELKRKVLLEPTTDFKLIVNQIKGDSLIGTFDGFFTNGSIVNEDYIKVENGIFRFKLEGMTPAM